MWREKSQDKLWINSLFIKSITIILVYVSRLKKNLPCISLLSHTLIIFLKCGNTLLSPFYFLLHALLSLVCILFSKWLTLGCSFFFFFLGAASSFFALAHTLFVSYRRRQPFTLSFLLRSSQMKITFILSWFHTLFSSLQMEDRWAKANKFFVALSIYKTLFLFSLELGIHYFFNKE